MKIPLTLNADAYTISSDTFASQECKDFSCYNLVNRKSPADAWPAIAKDSRMIFYGVNNAIRTILQKVTKQDINEAEEFLKSAHSFGGPLPFPKDKWNWIVDHNNGFLPIQISTIPEGETFFPNEPVLHVWNTVDGFGEFAAFVEARLLGTVSIASATATLARHYLEFCREQVRIDNTILQLPTDLNTLDKEARWMVHNFGDRGTICTEESVIKSKAHLLSFFGSDSFGGCYEAFKEGAKRPTGSSILALAHRNVSGFNQEIEAFRSLANSTINDNVRIASFVSDCYNYKAAVDLIINEAKLNPDMIYVIRPDSGDMLDVISYVYYRCVENKLYNEINGYKLPKNVRLIYGDSVKPHTWLNVNEELRKIGCLPTKWFICGVGGYLMTTANRDSLSSAFKLCVKGKNHLPVVKLSETKGKLSIPYRTHLVRDFVETPITVHRIDDCTIVGPKGKLVCVNYYDQYNLKFESFNSIQNRAISSFDDLNYLSKLNPTFGMNRENLHHNIIELQDNFFKKYRN